MSRWEPPADPGDPSDRETLTEYLAASTGDLESARPQPLRADVWRRFRRNKLAMIGLSIVLVLVVLAVLAPVLAPFEPLKIDPAHSREGPSSDHLFGTDRVGRDMFSRILYGARVSLRVGMLAELIAVSIGIVLGALAGWYGGWVDSVLMRFTDILLALPYFILALAIIAVVGPGENTVILVLGFTGWLSIARVLRASFLQLKQLEFVEAGRALGFSDVRLMFRHVLPNAIQPIIVYGTLGVGSAVLSEAAFSFLGVGVQDPKPAWGLMISQSKGLFATSPHLLFFPGAAIFIMVLSFVFVGDGLRDALDPRLK